MALVVFLPRNNQRELEGKQQFKLESIHFLITKVPDGCPLLVAVKRLVIHFVCQQRCGEQQSLNVVAC